MFPHGIIQKCADIRDLRILPCVTGGIPVITELASQEKVIGVKQSRKAIREGRAKRVYLVCLSSTDMGAAQPAASCIFMLDRRVKKFMRVLESLPIEARVPSWLYSKLRALRMERLMATSTESWLAPM